MRSTLTDAPVASFTTLPLRAKQHTTGLMVKVAPLLPPRGLLSSQRQLRWTHTWGLALLGQDVVTSAAVRYQLQFRLDVNNLALVLTFNF